MGQTYIAEPDADGEEARTLRPLQAAAHPNLHCLPAWRVHATAGGAVAAAEAASIKDRFPAVTFGNWMPGLGRSRPYGSQHEPTAERPIA